MPRAAERAEIARSSIAIVTTDELVRPEAEKFLANYKLSVLNSWDDLRSLLKKQRVAAVLLDIDTVAATSEEGISVLRELRTLGPDLVLGAMTRSGRHNLRLKAIEASVDEYFVAPVDFQEVQIVLGRALDKRALEIENRGLRVEQGRQRSFAELIGESVPMQRVYEAITRVAQGSTTILIRGESGTGKELVARAIVSSGPRAQKPFISINCAALPENLIEAELFGHEKGAFTDAHAAKPGHIEMAHTGTLFLDEIATLTLALQSKLLRVLEDRAVQRIGGKTSKKIDFRLITASNEDLEEMVRTGRFREDLYYRIHVVPIFLPPLRERTGDVALLVNHFLRVYCAANKVPSKGVEPEVMQILEEDPWPGNVRELENLVQRLVLMVDGRVIKVHHLPQRILYHSAASQESLLIPENGVDFEAEMARIEAAYINAALRRSDGSKVGAARLLHVDKQKLHYLCRKYQLGRD